MDIQGWDTLIVGLGTSAWAFREFHAARRAREVEVLLDVMQLLEGGTLMTTHALLHTKCAELAELAQDKGKTPEQKYNGLPEVLGSPNRLVAVRRDLALLEYGAALGLTNRMPQHIYNTYFTATIVDLWKPISSMMEITRNAIGTTVYLQHCEMVVALAKRRASSPIKWFYKQRLRTRPKVLVDLVWKVNDDAANIDIGKDAPRGIASGLYSAIAHGLGRQFK